MSTELDDLIRLRHDGTIGADVVPAADNRREGSIVMTVRTFPSPTPLSPRWA